MDLEHASTKQIIEELSHRSRYLGVVMLPRGRADLHFHSAAEEPELEAELLGALTLLQAQIQADVPNR